MKPVINLDELEFVDRGQGKFAGKRASVGDRIGARRLGYNVSVCPPGNVMYPFHSHRVGEEMFFILEGEGKLRYGAREFPLRAGDFVACPPGGPETAHQFVNTGAVDLVYLALGTNDPTDVCEYPDSGKVGVYAGEDGRKFALRKLFRAETDVDYFDRE